MNRQRLQLLPLLLATLTMTADRVNTTRKHLTKKQLITATTAAPTTPTDTIVNPTTQITFYGYEKALSSNYETLFITNNTDSTITSLTFTITYLDTSSRTIHTRQVAPTPSKSTRSQSTYASSTTPTSTTTAASTPTAISSAVTTKATATASRPSSTAAKSATATTNSNARATKNATNNAKFIIPPHSTRRLDIPSWDKQKSYYYIKGKQPRTSATPYSITIHPDTLLLIP
jgi:hypothetical protein